MNGDQSLSWAEFEAASKEVFDSGGEVEQLEGAVHVEGGASSATVDGAEGCAVATGSEVKVELENRQLWRQFDEITNEMIITKAGRYIFHYRVDCNSSLLVYHTVPNLSSFRCRRNERAWLMPMSWLY